MVRSRRWFHVLPYSFLGLIAGIAAIPSVALAATFDKTDQGVAYAECMAAWSAVQSYKGPAGTSKIDPSNYRNHKCTHDEGSRQYRCSAAQVSASSGGYQTMRACFTLVQGSDYWRYPADGKCDSRDTQVNGWAVDENPETSNDVCDLGCMMDYSLVVGAGGEVQNTWTPSGSTCDNSEVPPPANDADGDGTPDDQDAFPNDPAENADADGDGIGDNADSAPNDGENGADDGEGNESDNVAGGGGTCGAPPSCSGDGIACATLHQQWQTRCAVERLATAIANGNGGTGEEPGEDEGDDWGEGDGSTPSWQEVEVGSELLDTGGFMGAGSCPTWGPIEMLGVSYALPQVHCDILEWIGYLVVMVALVVAARILGS